MRSIWLSLLVCAGLAAVLLAAGCDDESCPAGYQSCAGECVDTMTHHDNCGGCGNACRPDEICRGGMCECTGSGTEVCDNQDNDCDGQIDEGITPLDCSNACGPGSKTCTNGVWSDCTAPQPSPEVCDGEDNDCDGQTDEGVTETFYRDSDNDRYGTPDAVTEACTAPAGFVEDNTDCDDGNAAINPGATEVADGVDNNCNGSIDEGFECIVGHTQDCGEGGNTGECTYGTQTCEDTGSGPAWSDECVGGVRPVPEVCDGLDNDCDGEVDDGMSGDSYEGNNSCDMAPGPLPVQEPDGDDEPEPLIIEGTLYSADDEVQDVDWYQVRATEDDDIPIIEPEPNCYYFDIGFAPPEGSDITDWEVCLEHHEDDMCSGEIYESFCTTADDIDEETGAYIMSLFWGHGWWPWAGADDGRLFFVSVRPASGAEINDCHEYRLVFTFTGTSEGCPEDG